MGTRAEAEGFVRHYLNEQNKATRTGDFDTVLTLITDSCSLCNRSRLYISSFYAKGQTIKGGTFGGPKIEAKGPYGNTFTVDVVTDVLDATYHDKSGRKVGGEEGSTQRLFRYQVSKHSGEWQVVGGESP